MKHASRDLKQAWHFCSTKFRTSYLCMKSSDSYVSICAPLQTSDLASHVGSNRAARMRRLRPHIRIIIFDSCSGRTCSGRMLSELGVKFRWPISSFSIASTARVTTEDIPLRLERLQDTAASVSYSPGTYYFVVPVAET